MSPETSPEALAKLDGLDWHRSSSSEGAGALEVAAVALDVARTIFAGYPDRLEALVAEEAAAAYLVRKATEAPQDIPSPVLVFTRQELQTYMDDIRAGEFDAVVLMDRPDGQP